MFKAYASLLGGYIGWGLFPLYWQLLVQVAPHEVTLHRIVWSIPVLALLVHLSKHRHRAFLTTLHSRNEIKVLILTAILITLNWGIYVWAVSNARVVEASLGYFLSPLLNIISGILMFNERLSKLKWLAIGFAATGVVYYVFSQGKLPWVSIGVGLSFAAYGALRKNISTGAIVGLYTETLMMAPFAIIGILVLHASGQASFMNLSPGINGWLLLSGLVTVIPLALFTIGTKLLPMTSVGILFFITPSMQFLIGIFVLGETVNLDKLIAFAITWTGLVIYSFSLLIQSNKPNN